MPVVDMPLQMRLGAESFAAIGVLAAMLFRMISYVVIQLVRLIKDLPAIRDRARVVAAGTR
jgi:hypothetical protein